MNKKYLTGVFAFLIVVLSMLFYFVTRDHTDYPVTYSIIAVNALVFLSVLSNKITVGELGTSYMLTLQNKEYYRVITSAFTHKEVLHILCNMYSLYNVGTVIEKMLGPVMYGASYAVIMLAGGLLSARIHKTKSPFTLSIGASGVICGLLGIYMAAAFSVYGFAGLRSVMPTIFLLILMTASSRIDSIGHFTGLMTGIVIGGIYFNL